MPEKLNIRIRDEQQLARHILHVAQNRERTIVGIAGIPGSGKSTLARHLKDALCHISQRPELATVVPLDGFHFNNEELSQMGLAERKGSPESFRAQAFYAKLLEIKRGGRAISMPIYSREMHEPVPDALEVRPETPIVLVEGNYVLCDLSVWRSIAAMFDAKIFVETPRDAARDWVIERHIRGGMSSDEAAIKYARNDKPNGELILPSIANADIIYENS